jgi:hypothetical protein
MLGAICQEIQIEAGAKVCQGKFEPQLTAAHPRLKVQQCRFPELEKGLLAVS